MHPPPTVFLQLQDKHIINKYIKYKFQISNQIIFFYCHITTAQVPWWVKFLWACSRQCKKNNKQFTYGQAVQKKNKKKKYCTGAFTVLQTVQKNNNNNLHMDRQCKKTTNNLHMDRQCKKNCTGAFTVLQTVQKNNNNLHMDSTYLQTVQKTMCKIHIHMCMKMYMKCIWKYIFSYFAPTG